MRTRVWRVLVLALLFGASVAAPARVQAATSLDVIVYEHVSACSGGAFNITHPLNDLSAFSIGTTPITLSDRISGWKALSDSKSGTFYQDVNYSGWRFSFSAGGKDCDLTDNFMGKMWYGISYSWNDQISSVSDW